MAKFNAEYDDSPRVDAEQVIKVINSCKTHAQLRIAAKMVKLWEDKHNYMWMDADYKMQALHRQMTDADDVKLEEVLHEDWSQSDF